MLCLGIETSCDETALALIEDGKLLSHKLFSQESKHAVYGGVVPELASREHLRALPFLLDQLLEDSACNLTEVDAVAVARGPGLLGSLLVGMGMAKGLVLSTKAKLIGIDHLLAHLLVCGLERKLIFPALGVLVSGGHTQIYELRSCIEYQVLGRTLDDAVGEAFDKTAKLINLPYPGGKYIDQLARKGQADPKLLPCPYLDNNNLNFSFSGLKTSVANYLSRHEDLKIKNMPIEPNLEIITDNYPGLADFCASFNWSVARTLKVKVKRALQRQKDIKSLILAGGVAANSFIQQTISDLGQELDIPFFVPRKEYCTDNGAMVAYLGYLLLQKGLVHDIKLEAIPRGKPIPWDYSQISPS